MRYHGARSLNQACHEARRAVKIQNAKKWAPRGSRAWLAACLALAVASGVRLLLHPFLGPAMPGALFCVAAALIEYFFGLAPALTVMLVGLVIADYLFVPPYADFSVFDRRDVLLLISYPSLTIFIISLIERLRRAQFRAELFASVAKSRYEMLLRADNNRALRLRTIDETHRLLRHLPHYHDTIILIQALDRKASLRPDAQHATGNANTLPHTSAPGSRFSSVHPADVARLQNTLSPGSHRLRIKSGEHNYKPVDCVGERFTTHAGVFLVLRIGD
jgi:K+-sensing histidine kinase KdpD